MGENTESVLGARVVLRVPGMESVILRPGVPYRPGDDAPKLDIRYPSVAARRGRVPAVVFVSGFSDAASIAAVGVLQKDTPPVVSWAELTAASGIAAVTYSGPDPASDLEAVLDHVETHGAELGIDPDRVALWACSGNVPNALAVLLSPRGARLSCAVLCYGFMLDDDGSSDVANAAREWGFVNPCAGRSADDLPDDVPLFVARAGRDAFPGVNASIDRFALKALARNKPLTLTNVPDAPHAFDLLYNADSSRESIRCMLTFMRFNLLGS